MNLTESFLTALDSLLSNKMRAVLTMLGVIIGVAAVIGLVSLGNGVNASVTDEITAIGSNLISVTTDYDNSDGYEALSLADVAALSDPRRAPAVTAVSAIVQGSQEVVYGGSATRAAVGGVTTNYFDVNNLSDFAAGGGLTDTDQDLQARVAVIGADIAVDLFDDAYPVGSTLRINGVGYEVVGVLAESGSNFSNADSSVFIPITTAHARLYTTRTRDGERAVAAISTQAASADDSHAAMTQIAEILRQEHGLLYAAEDDFELFSQADLLSAVDTVTGTLTAFLGAIAGISLLVGGIGIMNIMLVSVTERTREIGIRKAIGALRRDILAQFLLESVLLSVIGGLLGILLGWGISLVAGRALAIQTVIDSGTILLATGFAVGVGLLFGVYPAWRAAGLRPIEALRYE